MKRARLSLLVVMLLTSLVLAGMQAQAIFVKDPDPGTGSGSCAGYKCDWCCQTHCGCSDPGAGWHFTGWCSCSSVECYRSCDWSPATG
jgi:hypothetical protein